MREDVAMTAVVPLEFGELPQPIKSFLAVMSNSLSGIQALNIPALFPKLDTHYPDGKEKYQGMLIGCMSPEGRVYFLPAGELANIEISQQILLNKFQPLRNNPEIKSSLQVRDVVKDRDPIQNTYSGALRGTGDFAGWIFGVTGWPEVVDHNLVVRILHIVGIIDLMRLRETCNAPHESFMEAFRSVVITGWGEWYKIDDRILGVVKASCISTIV